MARIQIYFVLRFVFESRKFRPGRTNIVKISKKKFLWYGKVNFLRWDSVKHVESRKCFSGCGGVNHTWSPHATCRIHVATAAAAAAAAVAAGISASSSYRDSPDCFCLSLSEEDYVPLPLVPRGRASPYPSYWEFEDNQAICQNHSNFSKTLPPLI